jgi:hypothetical protein
VGHRPAALFGVFTSDGQDLGDLLGGELARAAWAGQVGKQVLDGVTQGGKSLTTLDEHEAVEGTGPAAPPDARTVTITAKAGGDVLIVQAVKGEQDHTRPQDKGLRAGAGTSEDL